MRLHGEYNPPYIDSLGSSKPSTGRKFIPSEIKPKSGAGQGSTGAAFDAAIPPGSELYFWDLNLFLDNFDE